MNMRCRAEHQTVDAEAKGLRHSEAAGRGRGAPNSPSFRGRRPWNPPGRGIAPKPWTRGDFHYHRHPREDSPPRTRTQRSGSRRNRRSKGANVAFAVRRKRSRADFATTQSPTQGRGSTLSLPWLNHPGDSSVAMLPLNDSIFSTPVSLPSHNQQGDSSVAALPLNDV